MNIQLLSPMDVIRVERLALDAEVGVYDHERNRKQRLMVDLELEVDLKAAGTRDALEDTLDYDRIIAICHETVATHHRQLIETVGEDIASRLRQGLGHRLERVKIRVSKPGATEAEVSVELER